MSGRRVSVIAVCFLALAMMRFLFGSGVLVR